MLTRRTLLGSAATPLLWNAAFADTPKDAAVMVMQIDDIVSLDPGEAFEPTSMEVGSNCYEKLVEADAADPTKISGVLASHWEVAGDGVTYTFYLRQDRKFASGNLVTAADVEWSLQRAVMMNKAPGFILAQFGFTKDTAPARIKATDDHTLTLQVAEAMAPNYLLYCLCANVGGVIEKQLALSHAEGGDLANGWLRSASAGSNAWAVQSWKANDSLVLDASPGGLARLKRMVIRHVAEPSSQWQLLQNGEADIARNLGPEQLRAVKAKPGYQLVAKSQGTLNYIALNQNVPELAHPDVAQAVKWAIDYDAIGATIRPDVSEPHQAFLPDGLPGALGETPFHKDVDKARALMKQANLEAGFTVTLDHPAMAAYSDVAQAVQADLSAIGIKARLVAGEFRQVIAKTNARQHQMAMLHWRSDIMDPHFNAQAFCINGDNTEKSDNRSVAWCSNWQDMDLAGRAEDALREVDAGKRVAQYQQLQGDFMKRAPFVIVQQQVGVAAVRKGVAGLELGVLPDGTRYSGLAKT